MWIMIDMYWSPWSVFNTCFVTASKGGHYYPCFAEEKAGVEKAELNFPKFMLLGASKAALEPTTPCCELLLLRDEFSTLPGNITHLLQLLFYFLKYMLCIKDSSTKPLYLLSPSILLTALRRGAPAYSHFIN